MRRVLEALFRPSSGLNGIFLVLAEIVSDPAAQKGNDLGQVLSRVEVRHVTVFFRRDLEQVALIIEKLRGHVLHRHYRIDETGGRCALRHCRPWRCCHAPPGPG